MDNKDQAANIIAHSLKNGDSPARIARHLADYGILADDLPAPTHDMRDPKWQAQYEDDWDDPNAPSIWDTTALYEVGVFPGDNTITIWDDGEPLEPLTTDEAKRFRLALHAAEQTAKTQHTKETPNE